MDKVIIFGCGPTGLRTYHLLKKSKKIVAFLDNDEKKTGSRIEGIPVYLPEEKLLKSIDFDYIVIASVYGDKQMREQLHAMGIEDDRMAERPKTPNVLPLLLKNLAEEFASENISGACAEVGVFRGVNAGIINHCFGDRKLHLYDTFEGFSENDIDVERGIGRKDVEKGQYNDTSIEVVMKNMEYPEQVIIHKGYFPDTARELKEPFCFVRIDLDLYAPTKAALEIFTPL